MITTVDQFEAVVSEKAGQFYQAHQKAARFKSPPPWDSAVQERMMRIGVEARALGAKTQDEFQRIATGTLHMDHIRYTKEKAP